MGIGKTELNSGNGSAKGCIVLYDKDGNQHVVKLGLEKDESFRMHDAIKNDIIARHGNVLENTNSRSEELNFENIERGLSK